MNYSLKIKLLELTQRALMVRADAQPDNGDKWRTTETGSKILLGKDGTVKGGMGGKFNGKNIKEVGGTKKFTKYQTNKEREQAKKPESQGNGNTIELKNNNDVVVNYAIKKAKEAKTYKEHIEAAKLLDDAATRIKDDDDFDKVMDLHYEHLSKGQINSEENKKKIIKELFDKYGVEKVTYNDLEHYINRLVLNKDITVNDVIELTDKHRGKHHYENNYEKLYAERASLNTFYVEEILPHKLKILNEKAKDKLASEQAKQPTEPE